MRKQKKLSGRKLKLYIYTQTIHIPKRIYIYKESRKKSKQKVTIEDKPKNQKRGKPKTVVRHVMFLILWS